MKGIEIKNKRIALNMTQTELADKFGISGNTIARWERDELQPTAIGMLQLAFRALEIEEGFNRPEFVEKIENLKKQNVEARERIRIKHKQ